ncbi:protein of unknown function [Petrocella atlantisensis]|uniref:Uncharacterized protein n=1 Tax=Petrocella atlantisensis TaxID=2173034 RepID=A0A3P7NTE6_9FIRM|nr:protein of unknown function [Petrocella atlantisensis]
MTARIKGNTIRFGFTRRNFIPINPAILTFTLDAIAAIHNLTGMTLKNMAKNSTTNETMSNIPMGCSI